MACTWSIKGIGDYVHMLMSPLRSIRLCIFQHTTCFTLLKNVLSKIISSTYRKVSSVVQDSQTAGFLEAGISTWNNPIGAMVTAS